MEADKDSRWFDVESVPKDYIFSKKYRPRNLDDPVCDSIPVIDLADGHTQLVDAILKASQEFGFFHVINHGILEETMVDAMSILEEFFKMPHKDEHPTGWIYTNSTDYEREGTHLWRENLKHPCHPLNECIHQWPDKPTRYREVIAAYIVEIEKLSWRILEMIGEGLGLDPAYFKERSQVQLLSSNFYPRCPDPTLTMGLLPHEDPSFITVLYQGNSTGLQVMRNGEWVNVGAIPNAFVVNIGNQLEIVSNWKLKSMKHGVVTSKHQTRISIATFVNPSPDCIIEPAKALVNGSDPSGYKASQYKHYIVNNNSYGESTAALHHALRF